MGADALERMKAKIEAIRKGAYDQGYAAAIRDMESAIGYGNADRPKLPKGRISEGEEPKVTVPRGTTRRLVSDAMERSGGNAMSPIEVQHAVMKETGTSLANTSVRRALEFLEGAGRISRVRGTTTWKWAGIE